MCSDIKIFGQAQAAGWLVLPMGFTTEGSWRSDAWRFRNSRFQVELSLDPSFFKCCCWSKYAWPRLWKGSSTFGKLVQQQKFFLDENAQSGHSNLSMMTTTNKRQFCSKFVIASGKDPCSKVNLFQSSPEIVRMPKNLLCILTTDVCTLGCFEPLEIRRKTFSSLMINQNNVLQMDTWINFCRQELDVPKLLLLQARILLHLSSRRLCCKTCSLRRIADTERETQRES